MKLATLKSKDPKNRDGELIVVSKNNQQAVRVDGAPSLLQTLQSWNEWQPKLKTLSEELNAGSASGAFNLDVSECLAPLPQAPGFYDGSAFLSHVARARGARGDKMPDSAKVTPLMYQGVSDNNLSPTEPIAFENADMGGDFEGEFAAITTDTPKGTSAEQIGKHIALLVMFNDITLREVLKTEIQTKFGFLQSKPNSNYAPFAITPDELGGAWKDGRVHLNLEVKVNGETFGNPHGREMNFSFEELVAHAGRTRPLAAGSIIGTGTVSNEDKSVGFACLTEARYQEVIDNGKPSTPWLKNGDRVWMNVDQDGTSVFGVIDAETKIG